MRHTERRPLAEVRRDRERREMWPFTPQTFPESRLSAGGHWGHSGDQAQPWPCPQGAHSPTGNTDLASEGTETTP